MANQKKICTLGTKIYFLSKFTHLFIFKDFIYLTEQAREGMNISRGSGRGRSVLPAEEGARLGARSQDPGTMT